MPKYQGLSAQQWADKAWRAETEVVVLNQRLQFNKSLVEECKRKINQLRREKRELMK